MTIGRANGHVLSPLRWDRHIIFDCPTDGATTNIALYSFLFLFGGLTPRSEWLAAFMSAGMVHPSSARDTTATKHVHVPTIPNQSGLWTLALWTLAQKKGEQSKKCWLGAACEGLSQSLASAKRPALCLHNPRSMFPTVRAMLSKTG